VGGFSDRRLTPLPAHPEGVSLDRLQAAPASQRDDPCWAGP